MKKALVLNTIKDAKYMVQNRSKLLPGDVNIFSTHVSVDVFLKEKYGIDCICLSGFLSPAQVVKNIKLSDKFTNEIVDYLDLSYSQGMNEKAGLKGIRFFRGLYSYLAYLQFIACLNTYESVNTMISRYNVGEVLFFDKRITEDADSTITLSDILNAFEGIKITRLTDAALIQTTSRHLLVSRIKKAVSCPSLGLQRMVSKLWKSILKLRYALVLKNRKTILLAEPLYDFSFLHWRFFFSRFNILYYDPGSVPPFGKKTCLNSIDSVRVDLNRCTNYNEPASTVYFKNLIIKNAEEIINKDSGRYIGYLKALDKLNDLYDIKIGIWGNSPIKGFKSLIFEYLIANSIPVIGAQHGGLFGNVYNDDVFLCDMSRCSDYISYGFSKDDLKKIYPEKKFDSVIIHEFGTTKLIKKARRRRPVIDILFPVTNTIPMLDGGMKRNAPDIILNNQIALIKYLDSLSNYRIVIKPFVFSDYENLALLPILEKAKNVEVMNSISFENALNMFNIKSILLEHHTTTLYEALSYDLEIFMVNNDAVRPIEERALDELKKRVHYSESIVEILPKLDLFLNGKLEKKRDDTFYNHYIHKEDTKKNILELVEKLMGS